MCSPWRLLAVAAPLLRRLRLDMPLDLRLLLPPLRIRCLCLRNSGDLGKCHLASGASSPRVGGVGGVLANVFINDLFAHLLQVVYTGLVAVAVPSAAMAFTLAELCRK